MRWKILILLLLISAGCETERATLTSSPPAAPATATPEIGITLITRSPPTAAVIQTTPTPLPMATATPTPTPIYYEVEEGDTLLGIAIENFTTVDEIQALNPNVVPELLQIGQALELPPPATPLFVGELATPVPLQVNVESVYLYRTPAGSLWVVGEVRNEGAHHAADVAIHVSLRGVVGQAPASAAARVVPALLPPGAIAPFATLLAEAPSGDVQPVVSIAGGDTVLDLGTHYTALVADEVTMTADDGHLSLEGLVRNAGDSPAENIVIIATFYDAQGRVSGYGQTQLEGPLAAGATLPFSLAAAPPGGEPVEYRLLVQGLRD